MCVRFVFSFYSLCFSFILCRAFVSIYFPLLYDKHTLSWSVWMALRILVSLVASSGSRCCRDAIIANQPMLQTSNCRSGAAASACQWPASGQRLIQTTTACFFLPQRTARHTTPTQVRREFPFYPGSRDGIPTLDNRRLL